MLKSTGIVRRVDELGRVVLPMELRRTLEIGEKDALEIFTDGDRVVLKKYAPGCTFCGGTDIKVTVHSKLVCRSCAYKIVDANIAADLQYGSPTKA